MAKIIFKNMGIYVLHRSNQKDHEKGRPTILLNYKTKTSLVWWGTTKLEKSNKEIPLIVKLNQINGYFYSKGIEKVQSKNLKNYWVNFDNYKPYFLSYQMEKQLITKFASFTNQNDPYQRINLLELEIQDLKKENKVLRKENQLLKDEKESQNNDMELELE